MADEDDEASAAAASALYQCEDRLAADVLLPHLRDPRPHVRSSAIRAISLHSDDDVVAEVARLLRDDPEATVRRAAASGLGPGATVAYSPKAEKPLVEAIAADEDAEVVENAKYSLGSIRVEERRRRRALSRHASLGEKIRNPEPRE